MEQPALARELDPRLVRQYGTLIIGEPDDDRRVREEQRVMRDLGIEADIESYGPNASPPSTAPPRAYVQGLFVAGDVIVDSTRYVQAIVRALGEQAGPEGRCSRRSLRDSRGRRTRLSVSRKADRRGFRRTASLTRAAVEPSR